MKIDFNKSVTNSSLIFFRVFFGLLLFFSTLRFILKGWIKDFYITPDFHFTYQYFEWVKPLDEPYMYLLFYLLLLLSLFITLGLFYRLSITFFFIIFTYIELIDKTYYLNHYYAISIFCFLMIFIPLNKRFSIDTYIFKNLYSEHINISYLYILRLQVFIIYFFAGLAKVNYDWIILAQPLKTWLKAESHIPLIGNLLTQNITAYLMSYTGLIYDLFIGFFLLNKKTRKYAFISVVIFHVFTYLLFNIGVFPWAMILIVTVFFEPEWFDKYLKKLSNSNQSLNTLYISDKKAFKLKKRIILSCISIFFIIQIILPLRHYFYKGDFFLTEQGFRFSWHVMLIEKTAMIDFIVVDKDTDKKWVINPNTYLTPLQVKMMSTQIDMILQFTRYLEEIYKMKGFKNLEIYNESYVSINGKPSVKFIKPEINLLNVDLNSDYSVLLY